MFGRVERSSRTSASGSCARLSKYVRCCVAQRCVALGEPGQEGVARRRARTASARRSSADVEPGERVGRRVGELDARRARPARPGSSVGRRRTAASSRCPAASSERRTSRGHGPRPSGRHRPGTGLATSSRGVAGHRLDDAERERLRGEPDPLEDAVPLGVVEELLRDAVQPERRGHAGGVEGLQQDGAAAADLAVVLDADHQAVLAGELDDRRVDRLDPARVDDGDADALGLAAGRRRRRPPRPSSRPRRPARPWCPCGPARRRRRPCRRPGCPRAAAPLGRRSTVGASSTSTASCSSSRTRLRRAARPAAGRARPGGSTCPTCRCGWRRRRR